MVAAAFTRSPIPQEGFMKLRPSRWLGVLCAGVLMM
ncbi:MAG: DUF3332 domain-containing protein, partial [Myxococcaceae bacterium]